MLTMNSIKLKNDLSHHQGSQQQQQQTQLNQVGHNNQTNCGSYYVINANIEPDFEYKGYYKFGRVLGKGRFGTVIECLRKRDNKPVALKFFKHNAIYKWIPEVYICEDIDESLRESSELFSHSDENRMLPSEVACLIRASHINGVVKLVDYLPASEEVHLDKDSSSESDGETTTNNCKLEDDESIIGIVLERNPNEICLFDYLLQREYLNEDEACFIMKQIVQISLNLLHHSVLHGDLKSENILIDPKTKLIKIIDFGSAQIIDGNNNNRCTMANKPVRTFRGTNLYKPPEYILHHCFYPRPSTVWTYGVILYDMVCGHFPFENDKDVLSHQDKEITFSRPDLSENLKDLIKRCLAFYVADRIVIDKITTHPWMTK